MTVLREASARCWRLLLPTMVTAILAVGASPSAAGGWWSTPQLEDPMPALAIGEATSVSTRVLFDSTEAAENAAEAGRFYAFLVRSIDEAALQAAMSGPQPEQWWTQPAETIRLGPITFGPNDANMGSASARFVVPEVPVGVYDLMFCNADCTEPLADVVPLRSVYVGDPLAIQLMRDNRIAADQLILELGRAQDDLSDIDASIRRLDGQMVAIDDRLDESTSSIEALATSVPPAQAAPSDSRGAETLWAGGGWFLAGALLAVTWSRRRSRDDPGHEVRDPESNGDAAASGSPDLPAPEFVTFG